MEKPAPRATAPSDTAVELKGVSKYFDQRQHDGRMIDNLLHPRFKRVAALSEVSFSLRRGGIRGLRRAQRRGQEHHL